MHASVVDVLSQLIVPVMAGVISAVLLAIVISVWRICTWRLHNRHLKAVCAFRRGRPVRIMAASWGENDRVDRMDTYALGHLVDTCRRIGLDTEIRLVADEDYADEPYDLVIVGGPQASIVSRRYLETVDGFFVVRLNGERVSMDSYRDQDAAGYGFGSREFLTSDSHEFATLIRFPKEWFGGDRTVHLLFGNKGRGTAAAAYYLWTHYDRLFVSVGNDPYVVVVKIGHTYKDITDEPVFVERLQRRRN
jgi:hypothetical protein